MDTVRREQIQRSLQALAKYHRAQMELLEQTTSMFNEEFSLDPTPRGDTASSRKPAVLQEFFIDSAYLTVTFRGKVCFLGNYLPYRLLSRLAERPNAYVAYQDLLDEVWDRQVSDSTIRSAARMLRAKLRQAGMTDLAGAIDGKVPRHYCLKLPK